MASSPVRQTKATERSKRRRGPRASDSSPTPSPLPPDPDGLHQALRAVLQGFFLAQTEMGEASGAETFSRVLTVLAFELGAADAMVRFHGVPRSATLSRLACGIANGKRMVLGSHNQIPGGCNCSAAQALEQELEAH